MKLFRLFRKKESDKTNPNNKQDALMRQGREQFKKLVERGTDLPVVLL
jgi:hypothetical protein